MYSVILLAAMATGESAPALHKRGYERSGGYGGGWGNKVSHPSYGSAYGGCYGVGYTGWVGYDGWSQPHAQVAGVPSPAQLPTWGPPSGSEAGWGAPYSSDAGWGPGYASHWPGYACYGGCGGYASHAYGGGGAYAAPGGMTGPVVLPPGMEAAKRGAAAATSQARLEVELPEGARLYVDDAEIKGGSPSRGFRTPALEKGQKYYYEVRAEVERDGKVVSEKRQVVVTAGQTARADFRDLGSPVGVASAKKR